MSVAFKNIQGLKEIEDCLASKCTPVTIPKKSTKECDLFVVYKISDSDNTKRIERYDIDRNSVQKKYFKKFRARIIVKDYPKIKTKEEDFFELAKNWKIETSIYSLAAKKISNKNYMGIIGMGVIYGDPIIKLILEDLKKGVEYWHYALMMITDKNPVPKEHINNLKLVREDWLAWGKEQKIIS